MRLVDKLRIIVEEECKKDTNIYTYEAFIHIINVVRFSKILARKVGADEEICEIAALGHDLGSVLGHYENHHLVSASETEEILKGFSYPQDRIDQVKYCILVHRGSIDVERKTLEAEVLASADLMSHFTAISGLFHLAYGVHRYDYKKGIEFVKDKLEKAWNKTMPAGKEIIKDYYEAVMRIFENDIA